MVKYIKAVEKPADKIHTVSVFDIGFMGVVKHDLPCYVCFEESAVLVDGETFQPCYKCQEKGWELAINSKPKGVGGITETTDAKKDNFTSNMFLGFSFVIFVAIIFYTGLQ